MDIFTLDFIILHLAVLTFYEIIPITGNCSSEGSVDHRDVSGTCYRLYVEPTTWNRAVTKCKDRNAVLVEVISPTHVNLVKSLLEDHALQNAWIGATQVQTGWQWSGNQVLGNFNAWSSDPAQPGSHCALIDTGQNGMWIKTPCGEKANYICEISSNHQHCSDTAQVKTVTVGARCFLLSQGQTVTWFGAYKTCVGIGGKLAHVTTAGVHNKLMESLENGKYWIGLRNTAWFWQSDDQLTNFYWAKDQPQANGNCIATQMYDKDALWDALDCNDNAVDAYICQTRSVKTQPPPVVVNPPDKPTASLAAQSVSPTTAMESTTEAGEISTGLKVGLAFAVIFLLLILAGVGTIFFCYHRRSRILREKARAQAIEMQQKQIERDKKSFDPDNCDSKLNNNGPDPVTLFTTSATSSGYDTTSQRLNRFKKYALDDPEKNINNGDGSDDKFPFVEANVDTGQKQFVPADSWKFDEFTQNRSYAKKRGSLAMEPNKQVITRSRLNSFSGSLPIKSSDGSESITYLDKPKKQESIDKKSNVPDTSKKQRPNSASSKQMKVTQEEIPKGIQDETKWADSRRNSVARLESTFEDSSITEDTSSDSDEYLNSGEEDEILYDKNKGIDKLKSSLPLTDKKDKVPERLNSTLPDLKSHKLSAKDLPPIGKGRPSSAKKPPTMRSMSMTDFSQIESEEPSTVTVISNGRALPKRPRISQGRRMSVQSITSIGSGEDNTLAGVEHDVEKKVKKKRPASASMVLDRSQSVKKAEDELERSERKERHRRERHRKKRHHRSKDSLDGPEDEPGDDDERRKRRHHRKRREHRSDEHRRRRRRHKDEHGDEDGDERRHRHRKHRDRRREKDDDEKEERHSRRRRHRREEDKKDKENEPEIDEGIEQLLETKAKIANKDHLDVVLTDDTMTYVTDDERNKTTDGTGFDTKNNTDLQQLLMTVTSALTEHEEKRKKEKERVRSARSAREKRRRGDESVRSRSSSRQSARRDKDLPESSRRSSRSKAESRKLKDNKQIASDSKSGFNDEKYNEHDKQVVNTFESGVSSNTYENVSSNLDQSSNPTNDNCKQDSKLINNNAKQNRNLIKEIIMVPSASDHYDDNLKVKDTDIHVNRDIGKIPAGYVDDIDILSDNQLEFPSATNCLSDDEFKDIVPEPKDSGVSSGREALDSPCSGMSPVKDTWAMTTSPVSRRKPAPVEELKLNLSDIIDSSETF